MDTETRVNFNLEHCGIYSILSQRFSYMAVSRGLQELSSFDTISEAKMDAVVKVINPDAVQKVHTHTPTDKREQEQRQQKVFDLGDTMIFVSVSSNYNWDVRGVSNNRKALDDIMEAIKKALPVMKSEDPNVVPVNFWAINEQGRVSCRTRRIAVPPWGDVRLNYTTKARDGLEGLMNLWPPLEDNGRLLLWHGVPGTGKSYGIRSLAQAWQKWCEVNYIVDPEKFFGNADYMLQVILQAANNGQATEVPGNTVTSGGQDDPKAVYTGHPWSLLIMEATTEARATVALVWSNLSWATTSKFKGSDSVPSATFKSLYRRPSMSRAVLA